MKKAVIIFLMLLFTGLSTNAVVVNYNPAGGVTSVSGGYRTPYGGYSTSTINNYGSNAAFSPTSMQRTQVRAKKDAYERQYLESLKNTKNINVNVNHNGYPVNRYYTNYGYNRYYPNGYRYNYIPNYAGSGMYFNNGSGFSIPGVRVF